MSATASTIVQAGPLKRSGSLAKAFSAFWYAVARYFARRAAIQSLGELNDRALRDIGIERSQIEAAVHGFIDLTDRMRM
jgi:uncharacterized protein YjiS (DUF1127 family)